MGNIWALASSIWPHNAYILRLGFDCVRVRSILIRDRVPSDNERSFRSGDCVPCILRYVPIKTNRSVKLPPRSGKHQRHHIHLRLNRKFFPPINLWPIPYFLQMFNDSYRIAFDSKNIFLFDDIPLPNTDRRDDINSSLGS